jgi:hypothetical protein
MGTKEEALGLLSRGDEALGGRSGIVGNVGGICMIPRGRRKVSGTLWRPGRLGMCLLLRRVPGDQLCLCGLKRPTPLSTTASDPTSTRSTRSMIYPTALSRTTVHGIPLAVRI